MHFTFDQLIYWMQTYQYFILLPLAIIEGPIVTVIGGFLVAQGRMTYLPVYLIVILGDVIGDSIYYLIGLFGRKSDSLKRFVDHEKLEIHFDRHSGKTLILGKMTQMIGVVFLIAAGMAKMPYIRFIWYNLAATIPKSLILLIIGFYFGQAYSTLNKYFDYAGVMFAVLTVIFILFYYFVLKYFKRIKQ